MKILVCGGRNFTDARWMNIVLNDYHLDPKDKIIHGGARGADQLAGLWATNNGIPVDEYRARWDRDGRKAGILRNTRMLDEGKPDLVIAFPGGNGTADTVRKAKDRGIELVDLR